MNIIRGTEEDILKMIDDAIELISVSKSREEKFLLYEFIGNCYSSLEVISDNKYNIDIKQTFKKLDNYKKFSKQADIYFNNACENFVKNKNFHHNYMGNLLDVSENVLRSIDGEPYSDGDSVFSEDDFYGVFFEFMKSINQEDLFDKYIENKRLFNKKFKDEHDDYLGLTVFNNINKDGAVFVSDFDYDFDSMFILAHEFGHVKDLINLSENHSSRDMIFHKYKSIYSETVSRLYERLFLDFMIEQDIMSEKANDKLIDTAIKGHDYFLASYLFTLLDNDLLLKDKYMRINNGDFYKLIEPEFGNPESMREFIMNSSFNMTNDTTYAYGDALSLFLKEGIKEEGFDSKLFRDFLDVRGEPFNPNFIATNELDPIKYQKLLKRDINMSKK